MGPHTRRSELIRCAICTAEANLEYQEAVDDVVADQRIDVANAFMVASSATASCVGDVLAKLERSSRPRPFGARGHA